MAEADLKPIEEINDSMWFPGSPVVVCATRLVLDTKKGELFTSAKFMNVQPDNMRSITFDVICYNESRQQIDIISDISYRGLDVERNMDFGYNRKIPVPNPETRSVEYFIRNVTNIYHQIWENEHHGRFDRILEQKSLYNSLGDYNRLFLELCARSGIDGTMLTSEPVFEEDHWLCACGAFNWGDEITCSQCKVGRDWLKKNTSIQVLENQKEYHDAEAARVKREIQSHAQSLENKDSERAEFEKRSIAYKNQLLKQEKKYKTKKVVITLLVLLAIGGIGYGVFGFLIPYINYSSALTAMSEKRYDDAIHTFESLNGFMDSEENRKKAIYAKAADYEAEKEYLKAAEQYQLLENYSDASQQYLKMMYLAASEKMDAGDYDLAVDLFLKAGTYNDADKKAEQCLSGLYREANSYLKNMKYDVALEKFKFLKERNYKDSAEKAEECTYLIANRYWNRMHYGKALTLYQSIPDYEPAVQKIEENQMLFSLISKSKDDTPSTWVSEDLICSKCKKDTLHYYLDFTENGVMVFYEKCSECGDGTSESSETREEQRYRFKIEDNILYQMDYDGKTKWYPFAEIVSLAPSSDMLSRNTKLILKDFAPDPGKTITFYGNVST